jgi:hypothetical protein
MELLGGFIVGLVVGAVITILVFSYLDDQGLL